MATFKATVHKHHKKEDGTYNVKIRVTHKRVIRYIATSTYVTKEDITKSLKIKNQAIIDDLGITNTGMPATSLEKNLMGWMWIRLSNTSKVIKQQKKYSLWTLLDMDVIKYRS